MNENAYDPADDYQQNMQHISSHKNLRKENSLKGSRNYGSATNNEPLTEKSRNHYLKIEDSLVNTAEPGD